MSDLTLFFSPGACSKVPLIALEQIGVPFETSLVTFANGGNRTPDYLHMNPGGKLTFHVKFWKADENRVLAEVHDRRYSG